MDAEYLRKVWVYLQQELPEHRDDFNLKDGVLLITVPEGRDFQPYYEIVLGKVQACVRRIRKLECDLDFRVSSKLQQRDFRISAAAVTDL